MREAFHGGGKVKKRTATTITHLPTHAIAAVRHAPKQGPGAGTLTANGFKSARTLPHSHVAAVSGSLRKLGFDTLIHSCRSRRHDLVVAMIVTRILDPRSRLAKARSLDAATATDSLGDIDEDELYDVMDWLLDHRTTIEAKLARKHLEDGALVLWDIISVRMEDTRCPLSNFGLLCNRDGWPVAVEAFAGNTADPATVASRCPNSATASN